MERTNPLSSWKRTRTLLRIGHMKRGIARGSSEDLTSEDISSMNSFVPPRRRWFRRVLVVAIIATCAGIVALVWLVIAITLIARLRPSTTDNGLQSIVQAWRTPSDSVQLLSPWPNDFSRDLVPKPCHSHNDYWRKVPLFDALAAGCTSIEADIWLPEQHDISTELLVGHKASSLTAERTLSNLYIKPLAEIMNNMASSSIQDRGVFEMNPNQTVTLLIDFKSDGAKLWPLVNAHLEPLRKGGWLRHWDGASNRVVPGPLTIVGTGNAPFDLIVANDTYRDVFYDAPLDDLDSNKFDSSNSYFASAALGQAVGQPILGYFKAQSMTRLTSQVENAEARGLLSRYWATPAWPVSVRDRTWNILVKNKVAVLNVDDLKTTAMWNWDWCVVAGLTVCGW